MNLTVTLCLPLKVAKVNVKYRLHLCNHIFHFGSAKLPRLCAHLRDIENESKVSDFVQSIKTNENIRGFDVHVYHVVVMEVLQTLEIQGVFTFVRRYIMGKQYIQISHFRAWNEMSRM